MQNFWNRFNRRQTGGLNMNYVVGLVLAAIVVVTLWWTPLLLPFRIFTTTIHEASHALAAVVTGGQVSCFRVETSGAGLTCTRGGWGFLISSAGYLGSTIFGGLLLVWAKSEQNRRRLLFGLTAGLVFVLAAFVLNIFSLFTAGVQRDLFTLILVGLVAGLFGLVAYRGPDLVVSLFVYITALLSVLYAVFDLVTLVFLTANPMGGHNDAKNLERFTGIPAFFWAIVWSALAAFILWQSLRVIIRRGKKDGSISGGNGKTTKPGKRNIWDNSDELLKR